MNLPKFEFLEHPADIKLQAFGQNLFELFTNAALGMMSFLYGTAKPPQSSILRSDVINVTGDNLEMLLVNWLGEILYLSAIHNCAYYIYNIQELTPKQIIAEICGYKLSAENEIKAVTYHELVISEKTAGEGWRATVVFDI